MRDASDIVRIIGEHLQLKPKGREYVGLCPFHDDHKPSMNVVPQKQIFHCFSCGAGGDVFTFVQRFHKMEFREALEYLAERAGLELTRRPRAPSDQETQPVSPRAAMLRSCRSAHEFFMSILRRPDLGERARAVIASRGLTPEIVETFGIGASPDRWDGLLVTLQAKNVDIDPYISAGLLKRRDSGTGLYDAFRNRLMFPIHDQIGRVIAFGARKIDEADEPKYLNSPESSLFDKSSTLYALHLASRAIQRERVAIITEGYMDAIACHQGGFPNAVATLGTALTRKHAAILKRLCDRVILLFDSDEAGQRAADRAVEILLGEMLEVRVATLAPFTTAKDPDELLKQPGGPETFKRVLDGSTDLLEFRFARLRARLAGAGMAALDRAMRDEIVRIAELGLHRLPPMQQELVKRRLAEASGVRFETISAAIPAGRAARPSSVAQSHEPSASQQIAHAPLGFAEWLIGCLLASPTLWKSTTPEDRAVLQSATFKWPAIRAIAELLLSEFELGDEPDLSAVLAAPDDGSFHAAAVALHQRVQHECAGDPIRTKSFFIDCARGLARESRRTTRIDVGEVVSRLRAEQAEHAQEKGVARIPRLGS